MLDVQFIEFQRGVDVGEDGSKASREYTSTTNASSEDESSAAEAQQRSNDLQQFEDEVQEAGQEEASQQDDSNNESGTDTEIPLLVERHRHEASSDDSTSDGSYNYHTDNNNSSIEGSDDEGSNTVPGLQERRRGDCSSDKVPKSIDTRPIVPLWMYASVDEDGYDADRDDDDMSTRATGTTTTLRMRGGRIPVVETVTDEDTEEGIEELEQPQLTQKPIIPTHQRNHNLHRNQNMIQ